MRQQIINVPAQLLVLGQMALNPGFQIALGTTCVDVLTCGEDETTKATNLDGDRAG